MKKTLRRRLLSSLAAAMMLGAVIALTPGSAFADTYWDFAAVHSGKCMDVAGGSTAPGAWVQQYTCNYTDAQDWDYVYVGSSPGGAAYYWLMNGASGQCLDVTGGSTAPGARMEQAPCHLWFNQEWQIINDSIGLELVSRSSGMCLDVPFGSTADGVQLWQAPCNGGTNQHWTLFALG